MARAFRIYATALKQAGGNQTEALSIAVSSFPDSSKTKKDSPPANTTTDGIKPRDKPKSQVDKTTRIGG